MVVAEVTGVGNRLEDECAYGAVVGDELREAAGQAARFDGSQALEHRGFPRTLVDELDHVAATALHGHDEYAVQVRRVFDAQSPVHYGAGREQFLLQQIRRRRRVTPSMSHY